MGTYKTKSLKILQLNVNGLTASHKQAELKTIISKHNIDIAAIQETHFKNSNNFKIPGYNIYRKDRDTINSQAAKGGGVALIIKDHINHNLMDTTNYLHPNDTTDCISLKIHCTLKARPLEIINLYIPPIITSTKDARTQNFSTTNLPTHNNAIVLGDINSLLPSWEATRTTPDTQAEQWDEWADDNHFLPANTGEATTIKGSAIDICFSHSTFSSNITWNLAPFSYYSDHSPIIIIISKPTINNNKPDPRPKWKLNKANWYRF
ncbi:MAG: endonuclease/exonuclease/phosphatase family protein [Colwellia sp.]|nr:endonuclease/exonuclease/phosphatase family protein [Colwellia sp.]